MRILVPVDGSIPSRSVLQFVSDRAKQMPVMPVVQLLTVEPPVPSSGIGTMMELEAVRSAFAAEGERVLESLLPIAGGIPLYRAVVYGRPGEEIANASDTFCADLIAMGTHGRRGVSRLFIGSTSHSVLALVERPLLFIKGTQYPEPTENLHITLAVDGSKFGSAAAKFIVRSRDFFGPCPTVDVVSVLPDMERWLTNHSVGFESIVVKTRDRWNEEADALWKEAVAVPLEILSRAGINARGVKYFGKPAQTIAEHARKTGGIVVIGSHGRGNFLQAVLGSTATKLCAVVDQPLLIVRMPSGVLDPKAENDDLPMTPETDWDTCAEPSEPSAASHHGETPNQH